MGNGTHEPAGLDERIGALKERIYATVTGLAILAGLLTAEHVTVGESIFALVVGIFAIAAAGFVAEVIAHQIGHRQFPSGRELAVMARTAVVALGTASLPLLALLAALFDVIDLDTALIIGIIADAAVLVGVVLLASARTGLTVLQRLVASALLLGLVGVVAVALLLAHGH
ncbi:hypothetical protein ABC195_01485 [Microbacterium sp. 2P01SA-2]|uniref:hypothetical protein n=1 Tax=unclassified Microbacterium TaxID=2609290 RepID=UPI0039A106DB